MKTVGAIINVYRKDYGVYDERIEYYRNVKLIDHC